MAFKVLYREDALADLEEIFEWSREKHPETTEQFAIDLFDHLELLQALPCVGAPVKEILTSGGFSILRFTSTTVWMRTGQPLKFCISGTAPEKILNSKSYVSATRGSRRGFTGDISPARPFRSALSDSGNRSRNNSTSLGDGSRRRGASSSGDFTLSRQFGSIGVDGQEVLGF